MSERPARFRQLLAALRQEARKRLFSFRGAALYVLVLLPLGLFTLRWLLLALSDHPVTPADGTRSLAQIFRQLYLPLVVYFGCAGVFTNALRREVLERTLHLVLLVPLRREVLLLGRFLGGALAATVVLSLGWVATSVVAYLPNGLGPLSNFFIEGPGLGHLARYSLVVVLAVVAYGALLTGFGLLFRRPAVAVLAFFGWELASRFLPPLLQRFTVGFYLAPLCPVPVSAGPFALLVETPSAPATAVAVLLFATLPLLVAAWRFRRLEVLYGED